MSQKRFCKQCLLKEIDEESYFENLYNYIDGLDEDIKTEEKEYNRRLLICKECKYLLNGMCRMCGCFVELRAAIHSNSCPNIDKKW